MSAEIISEIVRIALSIGFIIGAATVIVVYVFLVHRAMWEFSDKDVYPWDKKKYKNKNKRAERQRR